MAPTNDRIGDTLQAALSRLRLIAGLLALVIAAPAAAGGEPDTSALVRGNTRFALELFGRLGLQLLIVTPLQKIHVIEPYVSAVGFVDNPCSNNSRLQTLTIEE